MQAIARTLVHQEDQSSANVSVMFCPHNIPCPTRIWALQALMVRRRQFDADAKGTRQRDAEVQNGVMRSSKIGSKRCQMLEHFDPLPAARMEDEKQRVAELDRARSSSGAVGQGGS